MGVVVSLLIVLVLLPAIALVVWNQRVQAHIYSEHRDFPRQPRQRRA